MGRQFYTQTRVPLQAKQGLVWRPCTNVNKTMTVEDDRTQWLSYKCKTESSRKLLTVILATGVMYLEHEYMANFYQITLVYNSKTTFRHHRPRAHTGSDAKVRDIWSLNIL